MDEPKKPDNDGLKGLDLDKFGNATNKLLRGLTKKSTSFFKKAKDAVQGDEAAKEDLADSATKAWLKTTETLGRVKKAGIDVGDKIEQKVTQAREKQNKPPAP